MHRSNVVEWYLNNIADQIETEEELIEKKDMFEKIMDRLIYHVSIMRLQKKSIYMCQLFIDFLKILGYS